MIEDTNFYQIYYLKSLIVIYTLASLRNIVIFIYGKNENINN